MTRKEKEVFRMYQDMVSADLFDTMQRGNEESLRIVSAKFALLHKLYASLRGTEQVAERSKKENTEQGA